MGNLNIIGKDKRRLEVFEKVNAEANFCDDYVYPNMLYAVGVSSNYAFAEILSIDVAAAEQADGVLRVFTAKDIPGDKTMGEDVQDQFVFAVDRVLYKGDVVAMVVAETYKQAKAAAKLVKVDYKVLAAMYTPKEAMESDYLINPDFKGNICSSCFIKKGDFKNGFEKAEESVSERYSTKYQEHAYLEPEAIIAIPGRRDNEVIVKGCMQNIYMPRLSIKRCLNIPLSRITVIATTIGGSFGGKLESPEVLAVRAALAAITIKRPIKYILTREESIEQSHKRHPFDFDVQIGASNDGTITSFCADSIADAGCYTNMSPGVIFKAASLGAGPYNIPNVYCHSIAVMTNNIPTGSMRGFGNPQAVFARECTMDELAEKLGISPYRLRKINVLKNGDRNGSGQAMDFHNIGAEEVLEKVAHSIDFENKYWKYRNQNEGKTRRRGVGLSLSLRGNSIGTGLNDIGRVYVEIEEDASVLVSIGLTEVGQGLHTTMAQITAESLGVNFERITINDSDSSRAPLTGACIASRGTFIGGNAIIDAAKQIRQIIAEAISEKYHVKEAEIQIENDKVKFKETELLFEEVIALCYSSGRTPASVGTYKVPDLPFDTTTGEGDPFYEYTYSCIGAEVEVDICTGKTKVLKIAAAHDIGRAMNPKLAKGQIMGGAVMSQGYSLTEDLRQEKGTIIHNNFDEYVIPTFMDVNDIDPIIIENPDIRGPYGARSLGEPALDPGAGAFINAVNMALGNLGKIRTLPADLENIIFHSGDEIR